MRFWRSLLCLSLLAVPLAAAPLRSGEMTLHLSAARLAPRVEDFVSRLCPGKPPDAPPRENSAYCRDIYSNKPPEKNGSKAILRLGLLSIETRDNETVQTSLYARALTLRGPRPLDTPCGRWTWSLRLDPRATQPLTTAILDRDTRNLSRGTFSGELRMLAQLRFESSGRDRRRVIVPLGLRLALNGPWSAEATDGGALADDEATNLSFFTGRPQCFRMSPFAGRICLSNETFSGGAEK